MILRIRLTFLEDKNFFRDFEIHSEKTFLDFHKIIQKELNYEKEYMASFFLCDKEWERKEEITLIDIGDDLVSKMPIHKMEESVIEEFLDEEGQRMSYLFDFFSDRSFYMEVSDSRDDKNDEEFNTINCIDGHGDPPPQTLMVDEFGVVIRKKEGNKKKPSESDTFSLEEQDDFFEEDDNLDELADIDNLEDIGNDDDDDDDDDLF